MNSTIHLDINNNTLIIAADANKALININIKFGSYLITGEIKNTNIIIVSVNTLFLYTLIEHIERVFNIKIRDVDSKVIEEFSEF